MSEIAIMVIDPTNNRCAQLVHDHLPIRNLIPELVGRLGLPRELNYQLIPAGARQGLQVDRSLAASGVLAGSQLYLAPARDSVFTLVLDRLYDEARKYVKDKLWDQAKEKLDQVFRAFPEYPDIAGIKAAVMKYAHAGTDRLVDALLPRNAASTSSAAAPAAAASGGKTALVFLTLLTAGGAAAYANREEIKKWWDKNRPEWTQNSTNSGKNADAKDAYGIFLVGPGEEVMCGQRGTIENTPTGHLQGWGMDTKTTVKQTGVEFRMVRGPFNTAAEARKAYDAELIPGSIRDMGISNYTAGKFQFDGGNKLHKIDNATGFLR